MRGGDRNRNWRTGCESPFLPGRSGRADGPPAFLFFFYFSFFSFIFFVFWLGFPCYFFLVGFFFIGFFSFSFIWGFWND
ncbi:hypothetical protein SSCG_04552 [Streptomyces clavuligerus]|nr:hypothetical protein SSCG_04552 [Streptomyces clavuligerus]